MACRLDDVLRVRVRGGGNDHRIDLRISMPGTKSEIFRM